MCSFHAHSVFHELLFIDIHKFQESVYPFAICKQLGFRVWNSALGNLFTNLELNGQNDNYVHALCMLNIGSSMRYVSGDE